MNANSHNESEQILSALGNVLRRRKAVLVFCLLGTLGPAVYYNQTAPAVYEASASVVFEALRGPGPEDVSLDISRELYVFNRVEEINSRAFAEDVAAAMPPAALDRFPIPVNKPPDFDRTRNASLLLDAGISAFPVRNSNIVRLRVRLNDPQLCVVVTNLCLKVLEERTSQVRNKGVAELRVFIEDQLAGSAVQLKKSEDNLTKFKEANNITVLATDSNENLRKLTDAEVLYNAAVAELASARERLAAVRKAIAAERKEVVPTVTTFAGTRAQKLREKLMNLEAQQADLSLQKYPSDHPQVVRLREETEQTKKALADEAMRLSKASDLGDPLARIERRLDESVSLEIEVEGLKARAEALRKTVERYHQWLDGLPVKEMELARLERERDANQKAYMALLEQRTDIRMSEAKQIPGSRVIDRPLLPSEPIEPRKALNLGMGAVLGLILGFGLGMILEGRQGQLGSLLEFQQATGWSVLARVPTMRGGPVKWRWLNRRGRSGARTARKQPLVALRDPESAAGEAYNMLRTQLELLGLGTKYRSLLVTSCGPRDGKSSTLSNLAASFGAAGRSTVVVDAELRRPTIHSIFRVDRSPGLADLIQPRNGDGTGDRVAPEPSSARSRRMLAQAQKEEAVLQKSPVRGVVVLASGIQTRDTHAGISWAAVKGILEDLTKLYEIVLVDSAPPLLVHDTLRLCGLVDAVVVVVDARSPDVQRLSEAKLLLERAGANVIGAVLNNVNPRGRYVYSYR